LKGFADVIVKVLVTLKKDREYKPMKLLHWVNKKTLYKFLYFVVSVFVFVSIFWFWFCSSSLFSHNIVQR